MRPGLLLAATIVGVAFAQPSPPPGQLIDLGGHRVHLYCTGVGSPTVMIVGAGYSFDWSLVQPEVAKFARVCTYDPSGTAWSDAAPLPSCSARVDEVHALLDKAAVPGPYVLTGLSIGALVARVYQSRFPSEVVGMMIVDHAFLPVAGPPPESLPGLDSPPILISQVPITFTVEETSKFDHLSASAQALHRWADSLKPAMPTAETAQDCLNQLPSRPAPLGDLPLAVISTLNDLSDYKKLQAELLALSRRSIHLTAEQSFHSIEIDQPELVVQAIRHVVALAHQQ